MAPKLCVAPPSIVIVTPLAFAVAHVKFTCTVSVEFGHGTLFAGLLENDVIDGPPGTVVAVVLVVLVDVLELDVDVLAREVEDDDAVLLLSSPPPRPRFPAARRSRRSPATRRTTCRVRTPPTPCR